MRSNRMTPGDYFAWGMTTVLMFIMGGAIMGAYIATVGV